MFGLGDTKIEIQLDKFNFKPGETIEGTVSLKAKKPVKAKGINITFFGEKRVSSMSAGRSSSSVRRVFEFKQPLDGEKEYVSGENPLVYPFKIVIPSDLLNTQKAPEGNMGAVLQGIQFLTGNAGPTNWYLQANLDISMGLDVTKKVQINLV
ncbi:MAG: hypothetical protein Q7S92_05335 [Candidatus Diapherotrites archaeon]|nr:hypothetical protein [Candidatus Diapherotrites archaeon]